MKALLKTWPQLTILTLVVVGCNSKEEHGKSKITIRSTTQHNAAVKVSIDKNLDNVTIIEAKTDSVGNSSFEINLAKPLFATIQIGEKYGEVYLSPNDDLIIEENGQDYKIPLTFKGEGAKVNNYISWVNSTVDKIRMRSYPSELSMKEFLSRFDSIKSTINNFHDSYIDSVNLPTEIVSMLQRKNAIKFLGFEEEYKFFQLNNAFNEKWEAYKNGQNYMEGEVSKEFENLANEIPFDTVLLANGYRDYQMLLNFYWQSEINIPIAKLLVGRKGSRDLEPHMTDSLIKKGDYPEEIREFLTAFNLRFWLTALGITPETDSVFNDFKRTYQKSNYLPVLNTNYNEWLVIARGKPAPVFDGYTLEGKKVSIKDLKGKIVYIDVWATWCGPCVAEIPASKKLQQGLSNENKIQFLNVSVDSDRSKWESFLKKDNEWKGIHIIIEPEKISSFYKTYKLFGIPAYILIDQAGNIVDMKASRPSEGKIETAIKQLLTGG